jgi:iron complex transport system substrate-binding protein
MSATRIPSILSVSLRMSPHTGFSTCMEASAWPTSPGFRGCSKWSRSRAEYIQEIVNGEPWALFVWGTTDATDGGLKWRIKMEKMSPFNQIPADPIPLDHAPRRIVSLQPSATVILAAVGGLDRLVACTKYCADLVPEVSQRSIPMVHDSWTADASQITSAKPDLVIASVPYQEKAVIEILKSGTRFLGFAPKTLADIYGDIAAIAGIVGASERGEKVIEDFKWQIDEVRSQTRNLSAKRVFCEEWGKPLIVSQPWVAELVEAAGGQFIGIPGAQSPAEKIAAENPDVTIAAWCGAGDRVPLEKMVIDRGWQKITAVAHGRVFCVRDEFLNTPAPTLVHGLRALAAAIHPDRFPQPAGLRCIRKLS